MNLRDYSSPFVPSVALTDLSPGTLAGMAGVYCRLCRALDGFWYLAVKERLGNDAALECDRSAWEKFCGYEMARISKLLNIAGNDVVALMKALQFEPLFQETKFEIELADSNNAVLTVVSCPILDALEREGEGREAKICESVEPGILKGYASYFNPDIEITMLKVPPRTDRGEVACKWGFRLENRNSTGGPGNSG